MKQFKFISFCLCFLIFIQCKQNESEQTNKPVTDTSPIETPNVVSQDKTLRYISANSGLNLREGENLDSKKLALVPFGETVKILRKTENQISVELLFDYMYEVDYKGQKGFMFGGYLSDQKPVAELSIKEKCVVFRKMDDIETDRMIANNPEEDVLSEIASDMGYYNMIAEDLLATKKEIKVVKTEKRFIEIPYGDNQQMMIDGYAYGNLLILYNGRDKPKLLYPIDLTEKELSYMQ